MRLTTDTSTRADIERHLASTDTLFTPPLTERVDVRSYAAKIRERARTVEAWDDEELVGLVAAYFDSGARACFVTNVSVLSTYTGRGVATRLLGELMEMAKQEGIAAVTLEVSSQSVSALALYRKFDFQPVARRDGKLVMRSMLGSGGDHLAGKGGPMRDHNREHQDNAGRKYAYDFDGVIRRYLLRTLRPYLVEGGRALELGCYRGDMTELLLTCFPAITVVEAASELAAAVQERFAGRATVITGDFASARLPERYENIFLVHTLEHLDDPVGALARIRDWLAPGGRLFVAVPNANALSRQIAVKMGLIEYNAAVTPAEAEHGHRWTYSMDVLLSQIARAGFRIENYGGVLVKPLANFQFDRAMEEEIVGEAFLDACHELAKTYPDLSASLYAVCGSPDLGAASRG